MTEVRPTAPREKFSDDGREQVSGNGSPTSCDLEPDPGITEIRLARIIVRITCSSTSFESHVDSIVGMANNPRFFAKPSESEEISFGPDERSAAFFLSLFHPVRVMISARYTRRNRNGRKSA
jgi:hypothetical protein